MGDGVMWAETQLPEDIRIYELLRSEAHNAGNLGYPMLIGHRSRRSTSHASLFAAKRFAGTLRLVAWLVAPVRSRTPLGHCEPVHLKIGGSILDTAPSALTRISHTEK
jgi:hypothetical protein